MEEFLLFQLTCSRLVSILLLSVQGWTIFGIAPEGCWYNNGRAGCTFSQWTPPLLDKDFGPISVYDLSLNSITGDIPAGAFSGLNESRTSETTYIRMNCGIGKMTLSRGIFTPNLHWVKTLLIFNCYIENGLPSRVLENLRSLSTLAIMGANSVIEGFVAHDALAGMTDLQSISVNAPVLNGILPPELFDGLVNLTVIHLRDAGLDFIPRDWLDGLVNLESIHLSNNNLQTLPIGLFDDLRSLTGVILDNNPWNCSCELMWLLGWSTIADGFVCHSPALVHNVNLEDAYDALGCTASTPAILSTSMTSATETTESQTSSLALSTLKHVITTLTTTLGVMLSDTATSLRMKQMTSASTLTGTFVTPMIPTGISMTRITTPTHKRTTVKSSRIASALLTIPSLSWATSTADEELTKATSFSLSSISSAKSVLYSTAKSGSASHSKGKSNDGILTDIRFIALISTLGALAVLLVVAAIMYQYVRQNRYNGSMNRINSSEAGRHDTNHQNRDTPHSS